MSNAYPEGELADRAARAALVRFAGGGARQARRVRRSARGHRARPRLLARGPPRARQARDPARCPGGRPGRRGRRALSTTRDGGACAPYRVRGLKHPRGAPGSSAAVTQRGDTDRAMCGILGLFNPEGVAPPGGRLPGGAGAAAPARSRRFGDLARRAHRARSPAPVDRRFVAPPATSRWNPRTGRYVIVFNGEIYNHRELRRDLQPRHGWRGTSDTETLLEAYRAWGVDCLAGSTACSPSRSGIGSSGRCSWRATGWASSRSTMRDRGRPLRVRLAPERLDHACSVRVCDIDPEALRSYLELGYVPAPLSFHRGPQETATRALSAGRRRAVCDGCATGTFAASRPSRPGRRARKTNSSRS